MQLGIFSKVFHRPDIEGVLDAVRAAGYACTQLNLDSAGLAAMPDAVDPAITRRIRRAAEAAGVAIVGLSGTYNMIHPNPRVRELGMRRLAVLAPVCRELGCGLVTLCTGTRDPDDQWRRHPDNDAPQAWRDLLAEMAKAAAIAEAAGIDLGIEPEFANVVSSASRARALIDELGSPRLRIILDPANLFETGTPEERRHAVAHGIELLADRIAIAHAKDRSAEGAFVAAGQGVLDYPHFLDRLRAAGFAGPIVTHGLEEAEAAGVRAMLERALRPPPA
jgi:sugar phosphate isomerase/epimerase